MALCSVTSGGFAEGAAFPSGDRTAVWARLGMAKEGADLVCRLGEEDVLELAGLLLDLALVFDVQCLGEETLGEAMPADHVGGSLFPFIGELHDHGTVADGSSVRPNLLVAAAEDVFMVM